MNEEEKINQSFDDSLLSTNEENISGPSTCLPDRQVINEQPRPTLSSPSESSDRAGKQTSTENMEVHKHPHHVTHKKKWSEYLLEFIMLFLAVFLGFVAENIREHSVEKNREKQYAKLLLSDLRTDSIYFIKRNLLVEKKLQKHREFYALMTDALTPSDRQIINAFLPIFYTYNLEVTTVTYNQMKASGSLRLIEDEKLIGELQQYYDGLIPKTERTMNLNNQYYANTIYPFFLHHFRIQDIDEEADSVKTLNPVIINRTPQVNQEILNIIQNYGGDQILLKNRHVPGLIATNKELIELIKTKYHLENK